jgi:RNA polymerase sigma-70 factor (ECF subfamily)
MQATATEMSSRFERSVLELLPDLLATAMRMTRNRADAEDLVAETVSRAWQHRAAVRDASNFRGWTFRILTNAFISTRRSTSAKVAHESIEELSDFESFSLFERLHQPILLWWGNPEQDFLNRLLRSDLERAIDALPDEYRLAVVLVDLQGFSYQESASLMDVPIGTVRSRLARGRALLQKALWMHAQDAGIAPSDNQGSTT